MAAGTYDEDVLIQGKSVQLWGRCPAMVEIRGSGVELASLFVRNGADGTAVRNLAVSGVEVVVLVSGDGDFDLLLDKIKQDYSVITDVYGVPALTANSLIEAASVYHGIEADLLL